MPSWKQFTKFRKDDYCYCLAPALAVVAFTLATPGLPILSVFSQVLTLPPCPSAQADCLKAGLLGSCR